jgi:glycosyltransferase involved in cell wall biosynthesis
MQQFPTIEVELVEHTPGRPLTGIGRYTRELYRHLQPLVAVRMVAHVGPPLTRQLSFLHHVPVGVLGHREGSIVHFMEDLGCSQMLWRPLRPAVATSHDLGMLVWPPEVRMHRLLDRVILRLSYLGLKRMDAVITLSEFSRKMLVERLGIPPQRIFVIYSGHDGGLFRPLPRAREALEERYGVPASRHFANLLYVGSELPRKNMATLLKALSLLPRHVRLLKVGAPGVKRYRAETLRLIEQYGLADQVLFFDVVPEQVLPLFYSAADVCMFPSFLEGFGFPVLEAMACGAPVVCADNSSMPELTGDAALHVDPQNAQAYAEAVLCLLDDPSLCERMAAQGRARAEQFTWARSAAAVAHVYRRLTGAGASPLQE